MMDAVHGRARTASLAGGLLLLAACSSGLPPNTVDTEQDDARAGASPAADGGRGRSSTELAAGTGDAVGAGASGRGASGMRGDSTASVDDPCSEPMANDTADTATAYSAGTEVAACLAQDDEDFYEIVAPADDAAGGYFAGSIDHMYAGGITVEVYTASDNGKVFSVTEAAAGASVYLYWAAAPGQTYRFLVRRYTTVPRMLAPYTLKVDYTALADATEPNDAREQPTSLVLGTTMKGYFFAGHTAQELADNQFEDWYAFDANPGMLTFKIENVATNINPSLQLLSQDAANVGGKVHADNQGASVTAQRMITDAGRYLLVVSVSTSARGVSYGQGMDRGWVPDNFTRPYELTVTQP